MERQALLDSLPKEISEFYTQLGYKGTAVPFKHNNHVVIAATQVGEWIITFMYDPECKEYRIDKKQLVECGEGGKIHIDFSSHLDTFAEGLECYVSDIKSYKEITLKKSEGNDMET